MTGPDPQFITQADWKAISELLFAFWLILGAVLGFALSALAAFGMIPSLAATRDLPSPNVAKLRTPLYVVAAGFFALILFGVWLLVERLDVISSIFWRGGQ